MIKISPQKITLGIFEKYYNGTVYTFEDGTKILISIPMCTKNEELYFYMFPANENKTNEMVLSQRLVYFKIVLANCKDYSDIEFGFLNDNGVDYILFVRSLFKFKDKQDEIKKYLYFHIDNFKELNNMRNIKKAKMIAYEKFFNNHKLLMECIEDNFEIEPEEEE